VFQCVEVTVLDKTAQGHHPPTRVYTATARAPLFPFPLPGPLGHFEDGNEHSKGQPVQRCSGLGEESGRVSQDARPRLARGKNQFNYYIFVVSARTYKRSSSNPQLLMGIND
jgi:hypothetical protein